MTVKERLIYFLEVRNISKTEFGKRIGVSAAYVSSMRKSMQPDKIKSITLEYPELNIDWLLTGDGEMCIKNSTNAGEKDDIITLQRKLIEKHEVIENLRVEIAELKKELETYKKALINVENVPTANVG